MYMHNYFNIPELDQIFKKEPFTQREAFIWLINNVVKGSISISLRNLASIWQWHYSSVKRFLDLLNNQKVISTHINHKITVITIVNYEQYFALKQNYSKVCNSTYQKTTSSNEHNEPLDIKKSDGVYFQEKKKIIKSENVFFVKEENQDDKANKAKLIQSVEVSDVSEWARMNLPIELNLDWELGKFLDYWNSTPKKPPKDKVAAFRNWLRKAAEIKIQNGGNNDRINYKNTNYKYKTSDFERFVTGGARALIELRRN